MEWSEMENDKNTTFVYLYRDERYKDYQPFVMDRFTGRHPFLSVSEQDFLQGNVHIEPPDQVAIFYHTDNPYEIQAAMKAMGFNFPDNQIILNSNNDPIGYVAFRGESPVPGPINYAYEFRVLLASPAVIMAILLGVLILILFINPRINLKSLRSPTNTNQ